jgi:hypothetical protein
VAAGTRSSSSKIPALFDGGSGLMLRVAFRYMITDRIAWINNNRIRWEDP